eukprot:TRINITY_DN41327_c0_g1_i1.p1 TRINITY_DN41327_c0_g1~~TRINITY_DN41327_c0_g1_i1.p1  ORF type:complete len:151 (+),score=21.34 TRINITY_DN41327_c0_g1_i1:46-498(+)
MQQRIRQLSATLSPFALRRARIIVEGVDGGPVQREARNVRPMRVHDGHGFRLVHDVIIERKSSEVVQVAFDNDEWALAWFPSRRQRRQGLDPAAGFALPGTSRLREHNTFLGIDEGSGRPLSRSFPEGAKLSRSQLRRMRINFGRRRSNH